MPSKFKVEKILNDEEFAAFKVLALDRRSTIDSLCEWIASKGHTICRTAVGNYVRFLKSAAWTIPHLVIRDEADARDQLRQLANTLDEEQVRQVLCYGTYVKLATAEQTRN